MTTMEENKCLPCIAVFWECSVPTAREIRDLVSVREWPCISHVFLVPRDTWNAREDQSDGQRQPLILHFPSHKKRTTSWYPAPCLFTVRGRPNPCCCFI